MMNSECNVGGFFFPAYFGACPTYLALKTRLQFILKLLVLRAHNHSIVFWTTVSEKASAAASMDSTSKPTGVVLISDSYHRAALTLLKSSVYKSSSEPNSHSTQNSQS
jgi:hypothetical protein